VPVGIDRNDAFLAVSAGETMTHVQGESLKVVAVVHRQLLNSPTTSGAGGRLLCGERHMDQPYSVVADFLSKFRTWPSCIQALWVLGLTAVAVVTVLSIARMLPSLTNVNPQASGKPGPPALALA